MYLMIRLSVNDFLFSITRLKHKKTSYQIKSHDYFERIAFTPSALLLVEWAHDAIYPSETTFVPICFYQRPYLNG